MSSLEEKFAAVRAEMENKFAAYLDDTLANQLLSTREIARGLVGIAMGGSLTDAYADEVMALIYADMDKGIVPTTVRTLTDVHDTVDANEYLLEVLPYEGPECTCPKNRGLRAEHSESCLTTGSTAWQAWIELSNKVATEVDRRLAAEAAQGRRTS